MLKDRQCNAKNKRRKASNCQQNSTQKTIDWATRTPLNQINYYRNFNKTTTTGATIGARVVQTEVLLVVICRPLYFVFPFFFLSLYCLSFFKLQFLITSLVSSIFSSTWALWKNMHLSNSCVFLYLDFSSVPTVSKPNVNVQTLKSRQNSERQ